MVNSQSLVLSNSERVQLLLRISTTFEEADKILEEEGMRTYENKIEYLSKLFDKAVDNGNSDKETIYLNMVKSIQSE